jgi:hypothetical protein
MLARLTGFRYDSGESNEAMEFAYTRSAMMLGLMTPDPSALAQDRSFYFALPKDS